MIPLRKILGIDKLARKLVDGQVGY